MNLKRIYRLWRREGLKVPRKQKKKRALGTSANACHLHPDKKWMPVKEYIDQAVVVSLCYSMIPENHERS
ncbi:MAG: hypothetical protein CME32_11535 [Gimesia sp.]|nr:hypothetical protein [Gimesia sp.]